MLALPSLVSAELRSLTDFRHVTRGAWLGDAIRPYQFFNESSSLDFDGNLQPDIIVTHGYHYAVVPVIPDVLPYVNAAVVGLQEIRSDLLQLRALTLGAVNLGYGSNEHDQIQRDVDRLLASIDSMATDTVHDGRHLLDGSTSLSADTSNTTVHVRRVSPHATAGTYPIFVMTPGQRSVIEATTAQRQPLATDELITINGISLRLPAGSPQAEVIASINAFTSETGVWADPHGSNGATRLISLSGGASSATNVVSSLAPSPQTSGFSNTAVVNSGVDIQVIMGGELIRGDGNYLDISRGPAEGVSLSVNFQTGELAWLTPSGDLGEVTVVDHSLTFQYPSGAIGSVSFPHVLPDALGTGVLGNQFHSLLEIRITTPSTAQDSIGIIDHAYDQVEQEIGRLEDLKIGVPESFNRLAADGSARLLLSTSENYLLTPGTMIGPDGDYVTENITLEPNSIGYLGFELQLEDGPHFGWLHIASDYDRAIIVLDGAMETVPGRPVLAGAIPEPQTTILLGLSAIALLVTRHTSKQRHHHVSDTCSPVAHLG